MGKFFGALLPLVLLSLPMFVSSSSALVCYGRIYPCDPQAVNELAEDICDGAQVLAGYLSPPPDPDMDDEAVDAACAASVGNQTKPEAPARVREKAENATGPVLDTVAGLLSTPPPTPPAPPSPPSGPTATPPPTPNPPALPAPTSPTPGPTPQPTATHSPPPSPPDPPTPAGPMPPPGPQPPTSPSPPPNPSDPSPPPDDGNPSAVSKLRAPSEDKLPLRPLLAPRHDRTLPSPEHTAARPVESVADDPPVPRSENPPMKDAILLVALTSTGLLHGPLILLFNRLNRKRVEANELRRRTLDHVIHHPGTTPTAVARALAIDPKTADHHLRVLVRFGHVATHSEGGKRWFFACDGRVPADARRAVVSANHAANRAFLDAVRTHESTRLADVAQRLGVSVSTAGYRASILVRAGLLERGSSGWRLTGLASRLLGGPTNADPLLALGGQSNTPLGTG